MKLLIPVAALAVMLISPGVWAGCGACGGHDEAEVASQPTTQATSQPTSQPTSCPAISGCTEEADSDACSGAATSQPTSCPTDGDASSCSGDASNCPADGDASNCPNEGDEGACPREQGEQACCGSDECATPCEESDEAACSEQQACCGSDECATPCEESDEAACSEQQACCGSDACATPCEEEELDLTGEIKLHWQIDSAEDNYGFYLNRSESADGPWERANEDLIPGVGTTSDRHEFDFADEGLVRGRDYFYQLYEIGMDGSETLMGTIPVHCRTVEEDVVHERRKDLGEQIAEMDADSLPQPVIIGDWAVLHHARQVDRVSVQAEWNDWEPVQMPLLSQTQLFAVDLSVAELEELGDGVGYLFSTGEGASMETFVDPNNDEQAEIDGRTVSILRLGGAN